MRTPSQRQTDYLLSYGKLIIKATQETTALTGLQSRSATAINIRNSQMQLFNLYRDNKDLSLRPYFSMAHKDYEIISIPKITLCAYLLSRLIWMDDDRCWLSLLTRISFYVCSDYSIPSYVSLVKILCNDGTCKWVGEVGDINCYVSLSKSFIEKYYGTSLGLQPPPCKFLPPTNSFKPATKGFYVNRFKLKF